MSAKVLVHARDRELAALVEELLRPYRYVLFSSSTVEGSVQIARRHGPIEIVLSLNGEDLVALKPALAETSPDTRLLELPSLRADVSASGNTYLETPGLLLDATELTHLLARALDGGRRALEPTVEVLRHAVIETVLLYSTLLEQFELVNGGNGRMVMEYASRVAKELGLSPTHVNEIEMAALLQDIGLAKLLGTMRAKGETALEPSRLRDHPIVSANLVEGLKLPWKTRHIVVAHHEWYNGLGYPRAIKGRSIPLGARIIAVVNAFFTMLSRRPGRSPLSKPEAMQELQRLAGRQFDPEVVEIFLQVMSSKSFHDSPQMLGKIMVLSGDHALAEVVRERFRDGMYDASADVTGEGMLARLLANPPDALVLDVELLDMSGYQLLHWIQQREELGKMAVVMIGAREGGEDYLAHDMGADDILRKPIRVAELVARVKAVLRRRGRLRRVSLTQIHDGEGIRGDLAELSTPDLVRMMIEGRKTALVSLFAGSEIGQLGFDGGHVVHARLTEVTGDAAFMELYRWRTGDFVIEHGSATAERTISRRTDLLVSEAEEDLHLNPLPDPETPAAADSARDRPVHVDPHGERLDVTDAAPRPRASRPDDPTLPAIPRPREPAHAASDEASDDAIPIVILDESGDVNPAAILDRASLASAVQDAIAQAVIEQEPEAELPDDSEDTREIAGMRPSEPFAPPERYVATEDDGAATQLIGIGAEANTTAPVSKKAKEKKRETVWIG